MVFKINSKKQFSMLCNNFVLPVLVVGNFGSIFLNTFWIVKDDDLQGNRNSYELEGCRLSYKEY